MIKTKEEEKQRHFDYYHDIFFFNYVKTATIAYQLSFYLRNIDCRHDFLLVLVDIARMLDCNVQEHTLFA